MSTAVQELMSSPPITCPADASLTEATSLMNSQQIGSVVVTDERAVVGILTERDLLRAAATRADPLNEPVRRWMTADPDVLGLDDEVGEAWSGLTHHHYRHLPVVDDGQLVGVVSIRDLLTVAQIRPASEQSVDVPRGLEGVVVAETSVGDVRGIEGFFHYRQYSATELAAKRSLEDVWYLLFEGDLPNRAASAAFAEQVSGLRALPDGLARMLPTLASAGTPLDALRTGVSILGAELGWRPTLDIDHHELRAQALRLCAVVPTLLTAVFRVQQGKDPIPPRDDLSYAANYLWMLRGEEAPATHVRAIEEYLILTIDHGCDRLDRCRPCRRHRGGGRSIVRTAPWRCSQPRPGHARFDRDARPGRGMDPRRGGTGGPDHGIRSSGLQDRRPPVGPPRQRGRTARWRPGRLRRAGGANHR